MPPPGKIASLPARIRAEVNQRLYDGQSAPQILPWLNALPEARAVMAERFGGEEISEQNLSNWRTNQFAEWTRQREREESLKSLSMFASRLAGAAGSNMSAGAQAIATGKIMEVLETSAYEEADLPKIIKALTALRSSDLAQVRLDQRGRALDLAEAKFQRETAELFLKWYDDAEAKRIASGKEERSVKVDQLRQMMFGENPYKNPTTDAHG
jgi:hypothetical protein